MLTLLLAGLRVMDISHIRVFRDDICNFCFESHGCLSKQGIKDDTPLLAGLRMMDSSQTSVIKDDNGVIADLRNTDASQVRGSRDDTPLLAWFGKHGRASNQFTQRKHLPIE